MLLEAEADARVVGLGGMTGRCTEPAVVALESDETTVSALDAEGTGATITCAGVDAAEVTEAEAFPAAADEGVLCSAKAATPAADAASNT